MAQDQLFYIGTSQSKEIRTGASITYDWGSYGAWTTFKSPSAYSAQNVTYNKSTKDSAGASAYGGLGGVTIWGTTIPATVRKVIAEIERDVPVRYEIRGYTKYTRTAALKKKKKMLRTIYNTAKPYQYRLQYQDKAVAHTDYSSYSNGMDYIYFSSSYIGDDGTVIPTNGHLMHPQKFELSYHDVRRNFEASSNNSDGRDDVGSYILSNVRSSVVTLELAWNGLSEKEGSDLLDTLNPRKDDTGDYNYLVVQYRDPAKAKIMNKTFFVGDRSVVKYANGRFKEIAVTLTEV